MEHLYRRYCRSRRSLRAYFAHSASFNICPPLIDFTSGRNETYFLCRLCLPRRPSLRTAAPGTSPSLPSLIRFPYLSCICLIVSPYCTVFFRPRCLRRWETGRSYPGDIINLPHSRHSVSVAFPVRLFKPESRRRRRCLPPPPPQSAVALSIYLWSRKHALPSSTLFYPHRHTACSRASERASERDRDMRGDKSAILPVARGARAREATWSFE